MEKLPFKTEAQKMIALKIRYGKIDPNVSLANKILEKCCEHLQEKYPELPVEKVLEIAVKQTGSLISNPYFLFRNLDKY